MKPLIMLLSLALLIFPVLAQTAPPAKMQPGAKVYIAPMEGELHTFLAAEIIKKKVPVVVVMDENQAEFILSGGNFKTGEGKWFDVIFGSPKDKNEGSVQLVSVAQRSLVWAGEAGDRSLWWGSLARGGARKVADRIIGKLKDDFKKGILIPTTGIAPQRQPTESKKESPSTVTATVAPEATPQPSPSPKRICAENGRRVPCPEDKSTLK
jgi:hypothetical protein